MTCQIVHRNPPKEGVSSAKRALRGRCILDVVDAANKPASDTRVRAAATRGATPDPLRALATRWRSSSKIRAAKTGREIVVPSLDDVHRFLIAAPKNCCYCGVPFGQAKNIRMTMDHRQPIARSGDAELANLGLCCHACNSAKGPLLEAEFRALLELVSSWEDRGNTLLTRLRGGFYSFRNYGTPSHPVSEETRRKMSEAHLGVKHSEEAKRRIGEAHLGMKRSEETKQRMSAAKMGQNRGVPWSDARRAAYEKRMP